MTTKRNGAEVGTTGTAVTDANKATTTADGDVFGQITITGAPTFEVSTAQAFYGTRSYHWNGGSGTTAYPRWTGGGTTTVTGFITIRWTTIPGSGAGILQIMTSGGTNLGTLRFDSSAHIVAADATPTTLGTSSYVVLANTWYRLDYQFISGATTSTGTFKYWLHLASDANLQGAGTVLASVSSTTANVGAAVNIAQTKLGGKQDSTTTTEGYLDESRQSDTSTSPALPGVNAAPVANAGAVIYCDAGTATCHLSGSATDDTAVTTLAWTRVSGPTSPTITNSTAGLGSPSATCTADVDVSVGHYVFRLTAGDGSLTHTDDCGVYVSDPLGTPAYPLAADANDWLASGGAASVLAGVTDGSASTGMITTDNPAGDIQWINLPPLPLGNIFVNLLGNRTASTAITRTVALYKEDKTTLIDSQTQTPGTSYTTLTYSLTDATKLATIPALSDRRSLWIKITSTV